MTTWPRHPVIYEVNTWAWLADLSRKHGRRVDLATVPDQEWDAIASQGFDAVWFMGVWERSPAGIAISMQNDGLLGDFRTSPLRLRARKTTSARPTACAATSSTTTWAGRRGSPRRGASSVDAGCG